MFSGIIWYNKDGGVVSEINGVIVFLREEIMDRTHSGIVLTLISHPCISGCVAEPTENCALKDDLVKLFDDAKRHAIKQETVWKKLCLRLMGYPQQE